jgi:hypothetical protein
MSELGQKRKCWRFSVMSALPHKADINCRDCGVRFVPVCGPIDIFHSATRFGGNDFEIAEFCLCFGSEHPNDGPRVTKPTGSSESR